jgi:hypothetical protein
MFLQVDVLGSSNIVDPMFVLSSTPVNEQEH